MYIEDKRFLIVFSHNQFRWGEENKRPWQEFPKELDRKLYACVRVVRLRQFGNWMMGRAHIRDTWITCSGVYGNNGLPCDYEKLTAKARAAVVEVPADLAEKFWKGGGHNDAGEEGPALRKWALDTF